jgi:hypothetical protein
VGFGREGCACFASSALRCAVLCRVVSCCVVCCSGIDEGEGGGGMCRVGCGHVQVERSGRGCGGAQDEQLRRRATRCFCVGWASRPTMGMRAQDTHACVMLCLGAAVLRAEWAGNGCWGGGGLSRVEMRRGEGRTGKVVLVGGEHGHVTVGMWWWLTSVVGGLLLLLLLLMLSMLCCGLGGSAC